jgi:hypothetical protein
MAGRLRLCCAALDLDGDGLLSRDELRYLVLSLTKKGSPAESDVDLLMMLLRNATLQADGVAGVSSLRLPCPC